MKIKQITESSYGVGFNNKPSEYPDSEQGAIDCFTTVSLYDPEHITKVYPDPYVEYVWAVHTKHPKYGSERHVVYLQDNDFETDDRSGDEDFRVNESTTAGSIATVSAPMTTQSRNASIYGGKKGGNLLTGKKTNKKYANSKVTESKKSVQEAHLEEDDVIIVPGQGRKLKSGFIPHGESRVDHEVEMARSDLFQAAKNAKQVYEMIQGVSEEEGLEGWVQEKIIKANDYLNSVREYLEGKQLQEMTGGVIAAGGVGEDLDEESKGLWANIHAKRERIKKGSGERMRKPGSKGAPSAQDFKDASK
jgi:hypothetical protein